jgi:hypothetical protein
VGGQAHQRLTEAVATEKTASLKQFLPGWATKISRDASKEIAAHPTKLFVFQLLKLSVGQANSYK